MLSFSFENLKGFLIAFIPGLINFGITIYILLRLPKNRLTNVFALLTMAMFLWQMDDSIARIATTEDAADKWDALLCPGWLLVGSLAMHFSLLYLNVMNTKSRRQLIVIYMPAILFILLYSCHLYKHDFKYSPFWGWVNYHDKNIIDILQIYWISVLVIIAMIMLFYKASRHKGDRLLSNQSLFIAAGIAIPTVSGLLTQVVYPIILSKPAIPVSSTFMTFFSIATVIALNRYKLFTISDLISNEEAINALPFMVFTISKNRVIIHMNEFAQNVFGPESNFSHVNSILKFSTAAENEMFDNAVALALVRTPSTIETSLHAGNSSMNVILFLTPVINNNMVQGVLISARDITELKSSSEKLVELNNSLVLKNKQLEESNRQLLSFNYIASHDLKEPLRKIQLFSDRIISDSGNVFTVKSKEHLQRIFNSSERMQQLIDALLEYSRINSGQFKFQHVDLGQIIIDVTTELNDKINELNADVFVDGLPSIEGIPLQLKQLFLNLIENALKYSRPGVKPQIYISSEKITDTDNPDTVFCKISIEDNGIGFEQKYAQQIFDLFQRLHRKDEYPGTGIGLAICKRIVQNHNGYIKVSGKVNEGARFDIYLPE